MRKVIFILAMSLIGMMSFAQTQTIYSQLKLNTVNNGTVSDSLVLVQGTDNIVRKIPLSSISPEVTTPTVQETIDAQVGVSDYLYMDFPSGEFEDEGYAVGIRSDNELIIGNSSTNYTHYTDEGSIVHYLSDNSRVNLIGGVATYSFANSTASASDGLKIEVSPEESLISCRNPGDSAFNWDISGYAGIEFNNDTAKVKINGTSNSIEVSSNSIAFEGGGDTMTLTPQSVTGDTTVYLPTYGGILATEDYVDNNAPTLNEVTNQGNVSLNPIHAPEFTDASATDSLFVANNRYLALGDLGNDYGGNWSKYFTMFDDNNVDDGFEVYVDDGTYQMDVWGNAGGNILLSLRQSLGGFDNVKTRSELFHDYIHNNVYKFVSGVGTNNFSTRLNDTDFYIYRDGNLNSSSFRATIDKDVYLGDVNGVLGAAANFIKVENSANRIRVVAPDVLQLGSDGGNSRLNLTGGNSAELVADYIYFRNNVGANKAQFEVGGITADRAYTFADKTGTIPVIGTTAPSSSSDTGVVGEIRVKASYIYVCVATDTWVRAALSTW